MHRLLNSSGRPNGFSSSPPGCQSFGGGVPGALACGGRTWGAQLVCRNTPEVRSWEVNSIKRTGTCGGMGRRSGDRTSHGPWSSEELRGSFPLFFRPSCLVLRERRPGARPGQTRRPFRLFQGGVSLEGHARHAAAKGHVPLGQRVSLPSSDPVYMPSAHQNAAWTHI